MSIRLRYALCLCTLFLLVISACSAQESGPSAPTSQAPGSSGRSATGERVTPEAMDVEVIRAALERAGFQVGQPESAVEGGDPEVTLFLGSSEPLRIGLSGVTIDLFRFPNAEDASTAASKVSSNGYTVPVGSGDGIAAVEWVGRPHFFVYGRLIVLYVCGQNASAATTDEQVLQTLRAQMGQEFTGRSWPPDLPPRLLRVE